MEEVGLIYTPGDMLNYLRLLNNDWQTLAKEIQRSKARDNFKRSYAQMLNTWDAFFADAGRGGPGGWWERGLGGVRELANKYARRLVAWRDGFAGEGYRSTIHPVAPDDGGGLNWATIALVLAGVTVTYLYFSSKG